MDKKILDATCGSRTIWFDKHHPAALYCDKRREALKGIWKSGNGKSERDCMISPDVVCDFTDLPFPDDAFFVGCVRPATPDWRKGNGVAGQKVREAG